MPCLLSNAGAEGEAQEFRGTEGGSAGSSLRVLIEKPGWF